MASKAPNRSRLRRTVIGILKYSLYALLLAMVALAVAVGVAMSSLPSYQELIRRDDLGQMIRVRAADGSLLAELGPSFGEWLRSDEIPQIMKQAMISVEDRRFRWHPGVDPIGIVRGIQVSIQRDDKVRGVSTITQQLARNIFLTNKRSFGRKAREAVLALALERRFSKDQILELYLNRVYFGGGAYGIDAASRRFFGHSAAELSLSEAAIIAGLVKAPSNYAPTADAEAARQRASVVIRLMVRNGDITPAEAAAAHPSEIKIVPTPKQNSVRYFTDWVLPQLDTLIDETMKPIEVWTTLDPNMQKVADQAINANTPGTAQGALVSLDRDGAVRAMVGGRDYVSSIYNRATQAVRQPGSAFKLFVYLAALEGGYKPNDIVSDRPISINGWSPRNSNGSFAGDITLRQAFAQSINTVSVRLGQEVGFRTVADMAQRFGITTPVVTHPSMTLGSSDVRLLDMTRAYASVAQRGVAVVPYGIKRVTTSDGELLYDHGPRESRVLVAPWVAAQMTDLLQAAVLTGTGRAAQIGRPVAGKTGTTSSNKDGWFLGFSSGLTTGVWMGRDDAKRVSGLQGGAAPARAFHDFMVRAVARRPVENFDIEVELPDWQVEPDTEAWFQAPSDGQLVDADGNPVVPAEPPADEAEQDPAPPERLDQEWLDRATGRDRAPPPDLPRRLPPPPQLRTLNPPEPMERRTVPPQP
ncbi:transglycosylase domain-containing protein [Sphingosinicella rhizophila]|uniref:peptidoglycan glycosyltransferase n=1 Tax=Sphingosinicella rhizophila TaxID=3050082 RepID=A0ABU3Q8A8_9SPHN|nr:PBP1A family penicillin-binding protein [Sphingosinicella sp. GR2756]MDT9599537.1 PBP1A family penicillin-binding protein [Sphingosinicella sp. GR2756]